MAKQNAKSSKTGLEKKGDKKGKQVKQSSSSLIPPLDVNEEENLKKGSALAFSVLSKDDSTELLSMDVLEIESKLKEVLQLSQRTDLKDAAILDYYVGATYWAKQQDFSAQQLSGFFSVMHILMNKIKDERAPLVDCIKEVCKLMAGIGSEIGPETESGGIEFFNVKQARAITNYIYSVLFQHFKLYEYMFSQAQDEEIIGSELSVEVPLPATTPFPPPLDEGISEEVFRDFLSIQTPSLSAESTGDLKPDDENKPLTPVEIELPPETADLFNKLTIEDVRGVVDEVSGEILANLQLGLENKLRTQENTAISKINKIHNILPETPREELDNKPQ